MTTPPLRDNQLVALMHLIEHPRSAILLPMGFGKTRVTIEALEWFDWPRTLIVGTKEIVERAKVWSVEIEKWATEKPRISLVMGTPAQRIKALAADADVYITSRDNLVWLVKSGTREARKLLHQRSFPPFEAIVLDELSSYKSWNAGRTKAVRSLVRSSRPPKYVWGLTGTPVSNHYMDLFSEIGLIDGGETFGKSVTAFRDRYFEPDNPYKTFPKLVLKKGAREEIVKKLAGVSLSMGHEELRDLMPPLTVNQIEVPLDPKQIDGPKGYRTFMKNAVYGVLGTKVERRAGGPVTVPVLADWHISTPSIAALRGKALQFTAGFIYRDNGPVEFVNRNKLDMLAEIVDNLNGDPVLVFYRFREELDRIMKHIPGAVSIKERGSVERWNAGEISVLVAHPASAGHGLNLQFGGSQIVFTTVPDSQEQFSQAIARLHRPGQDNPVMAHILHTSGTWDDLAYANVMGKRATDQDLLEQLHHLLDS